jgi:cytochrome c nitrite reductase small subunit
MEANEAQMRSRTGQISVLALLAAGAVGLALGMGGLSFHYGEGTAYLSDDPAACVNCHIMQEQFDSWVKSSHHIAATCNSCHLPEGPIHKWVSKADNGFFHSWAFTFRNHPDPIRIKPRNRNIVHANCVSCHADLVHEVLPDQLDGRGATCLHCHKDVGHAAWR